VTAPEQQVLFSAGDGGYHTYRIPALVVSASGAVLAFCEGRRDSARDAGEIDLLLRRSLDGGQTFGPQTVFATQPGWTCGNPAPLLDAQTGTVWLLYCKNRADGDENLICQGKAPRTVWLTHSADDGITWSAPVEITPDVKPEQWSWYATGPGHGIQLRSGRLLVPCDHVVLRDRNRGDPHHAHVVYSDDHGASWHVGGTVDEGTNESTAAEAADGWLYINCRNARRSQDGRTFRRLAWSHDGGLTFSPTVRDAALPEPVCQASVLRYQAKNVDGADVMVFSNPAASDTTCRGRNHLTLRLSFDACRTWPGATVLWPGPAAYSDLCRTTDGTLCCVFEHGDQEPYERISLARLDMAGLTAATAVTTPLRRPVPRPSSD
jgi:sialidase-1